MSPDAHTFTLRLLCLLSSPYHLAHQFTQGNMAHIHTDMG